MERPTYIIVGASGGIGQALSRKLAEGGAQLVLAARDLGRLEPLASSLEAEASSLDATSFEAFDALAADVRERHGRLDGVALCVGSILLRPAHLTDEEQFASVVEANLRTAFAAVRAGARSIGGGANGGSIALVSSAAARIGLPNHEAIAAAKAGVEGLVRAAAATYARKNIRVNAVAPGLVETPLSASLLEREAARRASEERHPLGRVGAPEEVASGLAWLLDPEQSWVTGQVLGIDGGLASAVVR